MRRRILITILLVTAFAVLAFFVPAAIAVRSRIQRSDLLELQREAASSATRVEQSTRSAARRRAASGGHDFGVYDVDGRARRRAAARRSPTSR